VARVSLLGSLLRTSLLLGSLGLLISPLQAQIKSRKDEAPSASAQEQEPPEEDPELKPKEYSFNPLEASRNITAGNFYFKKGNYRAASNRYLEASKWDPTSQEALLRLAEADEKLHNIAGAREAYTKYLTLDPPAKDADAVKKKLEKLPEDPHKKK
jgi:tetratricopeptide (TPR) repeat protein